MSQLRGSATGSLKIDAPPSRVYSIVADYDQHHPRILPPQYFKAIRVEQGGVGAGTRLTVTMRVMGTTQTFRHTVTEPEPGRVLVESDAEGYSVTTFTVAQVDSGRASLLSITTEFTPRKTGLLGRIERYFTRRVLCRIYDKELALISDYAKQMETESRSVKHPYGL
jgi:hypothetical protein